MRNISIDELFSMLEGYNHRELHVHHTWKPNHSHFNGTNGIELNENMRNYHVNTNGWDDIAQHVTLLPDGLFVTGRDFGKDPASIKGQNWGLPFCVEMIGDFDKGHDVFDGNQKQSMLRLARFFYDKGKYIRFHRENALKTCPGTSINKDVFMQEVKALGEKFQGIPQWKVAIHEDALANGIITSDWSAKLDDPAPVWMVLAVANNIKKAQESTRASE